MKKLMVRLGGYARTQTSENTKTAPFTFCTTGGAYCQIGDVTLATPESTFYAGARCLLAYVRGIPMQLVTGLSTTLVLSIQCSIRLLYWMRNTVIRGHIWFVLTARGRAISVPCEAPKVTSVHDEASIGHVHPTSARILGAEFARSAGIQWDDGPPKLFYTSASARIVGAEFARSAGIQWDDGPPKLLNTPASARATGEQFARSAGMYGTKVLRNYWTPPPTPVP